MLVQKVPFKINLNTKEFKEDYIEQKDLTLQIEYSLDNF